MRRLPGQPADPPDRPVASESPPGARPLRWGDPRGRGPAAPWWPPGGGPLPPGPQLGGSGPQAVLWGSGEALGLTSRWIGTGEDQVGGATGSPRQETTGGHLPQRWPETMCPQEARGSGWRDGHRGRSPGVALERQGSWLSDPGGCSRRGWVGSWGEAHRPGSGPQGQCPSRPPWPHTHQYPPHMLSRLCQAGAMPLWSQTCLTGSRWHRPAGVA